MLKSFHRNAPQTGIEIVEWNLPILKSGNRRIVLHQRYLVKLMPRRNETFFVYFCHRKSEWSPASGSRCSSNGYLCFRATSEKCRQNRLEQPCTNSSLKTSTGAPDVMVEPFDSILLSLSFDDNTTVAQNGFPPRTTSIPNRVGVNCRQYPGTKPSRRPLARVEDTGRSCWAALTISVEIYNETKDL